MPWFRPMFRKRKLSDSWMITLHRKKFISDKVFARYYSIKFPSIDYSMEEHFSAIYLTEINVNRSRENFRFLSKVRFFMKIENDENLSLFFVSRVQYTLNTSWHVPEICLRQSTCYVLPSNLWLNANLQTRYMYTIGICIYMYEELSSACSAPHTQYKSQTKLTRKWYHTKKTSHHTKNESRLGTRNRYFVDII